MSDGSLESSHLRFVDWFVDHLYQEGTRQVFGVPGGGTSLDLIDAAKRRGLEMVLTAREDAAVMMAGVAGVLLDSPGIAFTTKGPGIASAANGLASASLDRMSVLVVSETFGPGERDYVSHQVFDQPGLVQPFVRDVDSDVVTADAPSVMAWLAREKSRPNGPAVMFPTSRALQTKVSDAVARDEPAVLGDASMDEALAMLARSRRPLAVVGLEAASVRVAPMLREFLERFRIPALTTYMAGGTVAHDHSSFAGIFTGGAVEQDCVNEADLIVLLGLDPVELIRKPWTYEAPVLDICEHVHTPHYVQPATRISGPLERTVDALLAQAPATSASSWTEDDIRTHRERFVSNMRLGRARGLESDDVVQTVAEAMGQVRRLTVDAGAHMFSACAFWPARHPRDVLISNGLASMGFAIPAGVAAAICDRQRGAVAMTGDGGALMCLGELKTAATLGVKLCVVVFNDACLSLIDIKREERQLPDMGLSWPAPDFAAIAAGFGFRSWRVNNHQELANACAEAAELEGPCLIDARIDASGYQEQLRVLRG